MFINIIVDSIRFAAVFLFGSAGETVTEKSGHLNLGTPGVMCIGAMGSAIGAYIYLSACGGNTNAFLAFLIPFLFCILFAGLAGALFSFITVTLKCNQNVTGLALTTFGVGLYPFVISFFDGSKTAGFSTIAHKYLMHVFPESFYNANWFTQLFLSYGFLVYLAIIIAVVALIILKKTKVGLSLRAVGENPSTADASGVNVIAYKYVATLIGSCISGLGGLYYLMVMNNGALEFNVEAFGWLAVALVIFSIWNPGIAIAGSFLFAALYQLPVFIAPAGPAGKIIELIPYFVTIIVLVIISLFNKRETQPPAGLGVNYFREDR